MAKSPKKSKSNHQVEPKVPAVAVDCTVVPTPNALNPQPYSAVRKSLLSIGLLTYLAILMLGPLSNPTGSPYLTQPLAESVSPIHRVLFQGHGYRFFGPDPGPSHRVLYRITLNDDTQIEGHFPNRDEHNPRLLYHRWFMLAETVFNERQALPTKLVLQNREQQYLQQIEQLKQGGQGNLVAQLVAEWEFEKNAYEFNRRRLESLAKSIAAHLLDQNDGVQIELYLQERTLPFPEEVLDGVELSDPSFLSEPTLFAKATKEAFELIENATQSMEEIGQ